MAMALSCESRRYWSRGGGVWEVDLSAADVEALGLGPNSLEVVFTSRHVAMPVFASQPFATVPEGTAVLH
jgi:hypothetical protein